MLYCMRWNQTMLGFSVALVSVVASDLPLASVSKMSGEEKKSTVNGNCLRSIYQPPWWKEMEYPPLLLHSLLSVLNIITWPHNCLFFLFYPVFYKQITLSEPVGVCPSQWRSRWNVTQTADWQGGTHRETQDEVEDGQDEERGYKWRRRSWGFKKMEGHRT